MSVSVTSRYMCGSVIALPQSVEVFPTLRWRSPMSSRVLVQVFTVFLTLSFPALSTASENGEIFASAPWTIPGRSRRRRSRRATRRPHVARQFRRCAGRVIDHASRSSAPPVAAPAAAVEQRPAAVEYSEFYNTRRKIHMIASWATIPMVVANRSPARNSTTATAATRAKSAHGAFTVGLAALFARQHRHRRVESLGGPERSERHDSANRPQRADARRRRRLRRHGVAGAG